MAPRITSAPTGSTAGAGEPAALTRLPARELRRALAVDRRRAQEGAVEHHALEPELHVALPGEADPAVRLDRVARDLHRALADVRLGQRGRARSLLRDVVEGVRGVPIQGEIGRAACRERGVV